MTIPGAGKETIAPNVVKAINIKLAGKQGTLPRRVLDAVGLYEICDMEGEVFVDSAQNLVNVGRGISNDLDRPFFVIDAKTRLEEV